MKISAAVKEYLIEIEVRKFTTKTIRSYRNNLNLFLRFCEEGAEKRADEYVRARSCGADSVTGYSCSERESHVNNQEI